MADSIESNINSPPPVRGRRLARIISILAVTSSCFLFATAGCCFLLGLVFRPTIDATPAGADTVAARIIDWKLPANFSGESGYTRENPLFLFESAKFVQQQGRGRLVVAQLKSKVSLIKVPIQDLVDQYAPELRKLNIEDPQTRTMTVNGLPATFQIGRGEDRASTTKYRQVVGHFRGKLDEGILILQFEDDVLTDKEVDEFLNSIK